MARSKLFLLVSLLFLSANFIYLLYFESISSDFIYDHFFSFQGVVKATDKKLTGWNLIIQPQDLANYNGNLLIYMPLYPEYRVGDILELSCKINKPEILVDEDGKQFNYEKYLAKDNIYGTCYRPRIKVIGQDKNISFYLFKAKDYFWQSLNNYLVEPASSLSKAILLAARREIPDSIRNTFARVGLSHMIAISGLHMAIIVWLLQSFLIAIGISRKLSLWFLLIILILYLYLIGFPSSAIRASLMIFLVLLGPLLGRSSTSIYSLILAADIFVLINPYVLLYDIGFQLSFLAVLGLLWYVKFFNKILIFIPTKLKLREVMSVTLAAQIFTWPLIIYHFGILSLIAPLANFLILPFLPFVLILSLLLALVGFLPLLANLIAWPLFILLKLMVVIAEYLAQIPYAYLLIGNFSLPYLILSFVFMFTITFILKPNKYE